MQHSLYLNHISQLMLYNTLNFVRSHLLSYFAVCYKAVTLAVSCKRMQVKAPDTFTRSTASEGSAYCRGTTLDMLQKS